MAVSLLPAFVLHAVRSEIVSRSPRAIKRNFTVLRWLVGGCGAQIVFSLMLSLGGKNIFITKCSDEIASAHFKVRMVTSQKGAWTRWKCLMHSVPLPSTRMMGSAGPSTLTWRTMAVGMLISQSTLNSCGICCSGWIPINQQSLAGFIQEYSKSCLVSPQSISQWLLEVFGNLDISRSTEN